MAQQKGINLKWPLRSFQNGYFETNKTTLAAIKEDIKTLLLTRRGERVVNCDLGTNLSVFEGILFDQINKEEIKTRVSNEILSVLRRWMPNVMLTGLQVNTQDDDPKLQATQISIKMNYALKSATAAMDSIQIKVG